jgi:hypothetical protein
MTISFLLGKRPSGHEESLLPGPHSSPHSTQAQRVAVALALGLSLKATGLLPSDMREQQLKDPRQPATGLYRLLEQSAEVCMRVCVWRGGDPGYCLQR